MTQKTTAGSTGSGPDQHTDVICLGHALVDRLCEASGSEISAAGLAPGAMTLVDSATAQGLESSVASWHEVAGGSAANTASGLASLGAVVAFAGSIGPDDAGRRYIDDLEAAGVRCVAHESSGSEATGVCHVFIAPDGSRTMATHLGAAGDLSPAAVEEVGVPEAGCVYVEGYLLDAPAASEAVSRAIELAHRAGTKVALSLSDPFVVERHRSTVVDMLAGEKIDILFGNEDEVLAVSGAGTLDEALSWLERPGLASFVTRGASGSVALSAEGRISVPASFVERVVDTTGAGDLFAAGALFALARRWGARRALEIGSLAAAEIISHVGARPEKSLAELLLG